MIVSASKLELPTALAWITDDTDEGTPTLPDENVRREIGPECSLDAAVMAESVDGERADPSVGSATTSVDCARCCCCCWNALIVALQPDDLCANFVEEAAVRRRGIMVEVGSVQQIGMNTMKAEGLRRRGIIDTTGDDHRSWRSCKLPSRA